MTEGAGGPPGAGPGPASAVAAERLLTLIDCHWATLRGALGDGQFALLRGRLTDLLGTDPDNRRAFMRALRGVQLALLQLPLDHPVRAALDGIRLAPQVSGTVVPTEGGRDVWDRLTVLLASASDRGVAPGDPAPNSHAAPGDLSAADRAVLAAPALTAAEARERCGGPPPPELIRLVDLQRGARYPEFQFEPRGGTPCEVVLRVNRVLLADIDPWGAAAWWFSGNTWLGGAPSDLLGRTPEHRLVGAATALAEGEG